MTKGVILAQNQKVKCCVITAQEKPDRVVKFAAGELARYLSKICGAKVAVAKKKQPHRIGIHLAVSDVLKNKSGFEGQDHFIIEISGKKIQIFGENPRSVLFGVYTFLEQLGCRWYYPLKSEQIVPKLDKVSVATGKKEVLHRLAIRAFPLLPMIKRDLPIILNFIDWMAKNHYNRLYTNQSHYGKGYDFWSTDVIRWPDVEKQVVPELKKRGVNLCMSSHSLHFFMPPEELYPKHPDWFALRELAPPGNGYPKNPLAGQLTRFFEDPTDSKHHYELPDSTKCWPRWLSKDGKMDIPHQLCFTNEKAVTEYSNRVVKYAKAHPEVSVLGPWPSDAGSYCSCSKCKANPHAIFEVVNNIAHRVKKVAPKMRVEHLVYGAATFEVPKKIKNICDNLTFFLCGPPEVRKQWGKWLNKLGRLSYRGDYVLVDNYACQGMVMLRPQYAYEMAEETLANHGYGTSSFFIETTSWWRNCLNMYFLAKASLDNPPKIQDIIKDYCEKYYGPRAKDALKFFKIASNDSDIPLDLTGHGKYSRTQIKAVNIIMNAVINRYRSGKHR